MFLPGHGALAVRSDDAALPVDLCECCSRRAALPAGQDVSRLAHCPGSGSAPIGAPGRVVLDTEEMPAIIQDHLTGGLSVCLEELEAAAGRGAAPGLRRLRHQVGRAR